MKVLLFEYVTGGGLAAEPLPPSLAQEGGLMLGELLRDFAEIPGVCLTVLRDARLPVPSESPPEIHWVAVGPGTDAAAVFAEAMAAADAVWPVAPETGGILERLCRDVEAAGKRLLACPAAAVRIAASKRATAERLAEHGVPVVPTLPFAPGSAPPADWPVVAKPDDGAGCQGAEIIESPAGWRDWVQSAPAAGTVIQPLRQGESLSLSALFANGDALLLSCNRQRIARAGRGFVLNGCEVNASPDTNGSFRQLAQRVAAAIPELWGYAGIDFILKAEGPEVLEINPRLTTSCAGLRAALGLNLARAVLELDCTGRLPETVLSPGRPADIPLESDYGH
jgi:predicted ATP-grasp superfamily ATP-dependent carboligase